MVNLNKKTFSGTNRDFKKTKVKVGKVKAGAVNVTDTSFKAKKLCIKEQQLSTNQKISLVAKGLGQVSLATILTPTLSQTGHYNVNIRKEAYVTLLKRVKEYEKDDGAGGVSEVVGILLEHAGRGMVDNELNVRMAVLTLTSWIFETQASCLSAFFNSWLPYLLLAITHLHEDIRQSSTKFLQLTLKTNPHLILPYTGKILSTLADAKMVKAKPSNSRLKGPSIFNLALSLMNAYTKSREASSKDNTLVVNYKWTIDQKVSLRNVLIRRTAIPSSSTLPMMMVTSDTIQRTEMVKIIKWLGDQLMDDWLEATPFMNNHHLQLALGGGKSVDERQAFDNLVSTMRGLFAFVTIAGFDGDIILTSLPPIIRNSPHLKTILDLQ